MGGESLEKRIRVAVRARPRIAEDKDYHGLVEGDCVWCEGPKRLRFAKPFQDERNYEYDHAFGPKSEQSDVYERVGRGVVDAVLDGYHGTVLAYGISGSGKTHTTFGPAMIWHDWASSEPGHPPKSMYDERVWRHVGIVPRALRELFERLEASSAEEGVSHTVSITFVQLYMERIQDLLAAAAQGEPGPALNVREDPRHGVYVAGATQLAASRWEDVLCAVASAVLERSTSSTAQNRESSRSHAVLQAHVATTRAADGPDADGMHRVTRRTLTLVDLAGSERVSKSQAKGLRLEECKRINRSIAALGNCVAALTQPGSTAAKHVPFRDSTLTRLLTPSLGGEAVTRICASVGPAATHADETYSTLQFARRAMRVQLRARAREEMQRVPRAAAPAGRTAPDGLSEQMRDVQEALAAARAAESGCDEEATAEDDGAWPAGGSPIASKAARLRELRRAGPQPDSTSMSAPTAASGGEGRSPNGPDQPSRPVPEPPREQPAPRPEAVPSRAPAPAAAVASETGPEEHGGAFSLKAAHDLQLALAAAQQRERMARERAETEARRSRQLEQEVADLREAQRRWERAGTRAHSPCSGDRAAPTSEPAARPTAFAEAEAEAEAMAEAEARAGHTQAEAEQARPLPPPTPPAPRMHLRAHISHERRAPSHWEQGPPQQGPHFSQEPAGSEEYRARAHAQSDASTPARRGPSLATLVSPPDEGNECSRGSGGTGQRVNPLLGPARREAMSASLSQSAHSAVPRSNPLLASSQEGGKASRHALSNVSANEYHRPQAGLSQPRDVFGERMESPARL